jgi:acyl-CoA synthetase (AMP-forming)/AMP-acid ligase II
MHPSHWAKVEPQLPAIIMAGTGETVSFAQMEDAANRGAQLLRSLGLKRGDVFAIWSGNNARFLEIAWAMNRAGVYMVPIAAKLHAAEAAYIVNDCGARVLIVDASVKYAAELESGFAALCPEVEHAFSIGGALNGFASWEEACARQPAELIADPAHGQQMVYSSGTTGKPKGVRKPMRDDAFDAPMAFARLLSSRYRIRQGTTFVVSAPLYHSGPIGMAMAAHSLGVTLLVFEKFDAEAMLAAIDRYRPSAGQFVPTMFVRLLKLPETVRDAYDVSSLEVAIHSAAPCPVEAKRAMIAWWGPILEEIYGGTENVGSTMIGSEEWLRRPGSVGRPTAGRIRICDEDGRELPVGTAGTIYFEAASPFEYLGDPEKTRGVSHPDRPDWATFGDIGHVDEDGYLFLSDRKAFMVISGGVNIYPQETENVLAMHPEVADVAAFGVPDPDLGERLMAVVQPLSWERAGPAFEAELLAFCRERLAGMKCPRNIDFEVTLDRDPAGKIAKHAIRARYWPAA